MNSPPPALLPTPEEPEAASGALAVLLLAVVQGLAEFLPISSSGHLVLGRSLLGLQEAGLTLDVALHVGTLAAVTYAYRSDCLLYTSPSPRDKRQSRMPSSA